jgi:hypothetical protein
MRVRKTRHCKLRGWLELRKRRKGQEDRERVAFSHTVRY